MPPLKLLGVIPVHVRLRGRQKPNEFREMGRAEWHTGRVRLCMSFSKSMLYSLQGGRGAFAARALMGTLGLHVRLNTSYVRFESTMRYRKGASLWKQRPFGQHTKKDSSAQRKTTDQIKAKPKACVRGPVDGNFAARPRPINKRGLGVSAERICTHTGVASSAAEAAAAGMVAACRSS